jgi:hypothetical protein
MIEATNGRTLVRRFGLYEILDHTILRGAVFTSLTLSRVPECFIFLVFIVCTPR